MPFYDELQLEIHKAMGNERKHFKATASHLLQYIITFSVMLVSMNRWMQGSTAAGFVMGLMIWFCSGDILHASTHYAVFTNANANLLLGWSCGWMHHVPSMWVRQHVLGVSALLLALYAAFSPDSLHLVQGTMRIQTCLVLIRIWTISGSLAKHSVDGDYHPSTSLAPHMRTGDTAFFPSQYSQELDH